MGWLIPYFCQTTFGSTPFHFVQILECLGLFTAKSLHLKARLILHSLVPVMDQGIKSKFTRDLA